ncbi:competence protein ComK [Pontibacillus sp. ALD_SL1]|uniref:competence protein ComK n=1 Tax=Pontibacillus sp. ALD_SL1 TaxID=2777185 RepID=UPI001A96371B|nr:competence protein ComK [Pontibacillus sp. ALD_SL1]QSS99792.1 competence protein ComK [Pontibacillus sp. ALD_SL1]
MNKDNGILTLENDIVTPSTMVLAPHHHEWYQARILDRYAGEIYSKERPSKIIETSCLHWMTSPEGIRRAMKFQLDYHKKAPLAIQPELNIFAFPTMSPEQFGCIWIFPWHVWKKGGDKHGSYIIFLNGDRMDFPVSYYVLNKQYQRTCEAFFKYKKFVAEQ